MADLNSDPLGDATPRPSGRPSASAVETVIAASVSTRRVRMDSPPRPHAAIERTPRVYPGSMRLHAAAGLLFLLAVSGSAADAPRDVTSVLAPIRAKHDPPALAGAIVSAGALEALGVDGVRERGKPEKATTGDLWHIGSCTKAMTATLCAQLVEEKTLTWTSAVGEVFSDVKGMDPAWKPVTLEQLLTNHSGAPANLDADGLWSRLWNH